MSALTSTQFAAKFGMMMQWMFEQASPAVRQQMANELDAQFDKVYGKPLASPADAVEDLPAKELPDGMAPVPLPLLHALAGPSPSHTARKRAFDLWAAWMKTWHDGRETT